MIKKHTGTVVQIIGSVVDVKFDNHLPNQNELLYVIDTDRTVDLEVMAHLPGRRMPLYRPRSDGRDSHAGLK